MKFLKRLALTLLFGCLLLLVLPAAVQASAAGTNPTAVNNLGSRLKSQSAVTATSDGYMRVFYNGTQIGIEYY